MRNQKAVKFDMTDYQCFEEPMTLDESEEKDSYLNALLCHYSLLLRYDDINNISANN